MADKSQFNVNILTLFPEMFPSYLGYSLSGKALNDGLWAMNVINIRDFTEDKHCTVDDRPFGGGAGMVMRPDIVAKAIDSASHNKLIYMSPRGTLFNQQKTRQLLAHKDITIICGRYEGLDQRVIDRYDIEEISIGDFILSGGEGAALTVIDACVRQIDGVLSNPSTLEEESFGGGEFSNLLEYPLYTRPVEWENMKVPDILCSGNHQEIAKWRLAKSQEITKSRRVDLWNKYNKE